MAVVTDITWVQLNEALKTLLETNADLILLDSNGVPTGIDVIEFLSSGSEVSEVIKFMSTLHDAAVIAQSAVNTGKANGEKLNSFSVPVSGTPVNNFVPITRAIISRADLRSVKNVIGTNV